MSTGESKSSGDNQEQPPAWEGAVVGFLGAFEMGLLGRDPNQIILKTGELCSGLLRQGLLANLGELQVYLRGRQAGVQLVAQPFHPETMPDPRISCIDPITAEPRSHWLMVSLGRQEDGTPQADYELNRLDCTHEENERILASRTGMLTIS